MFKKCFLIILALLLLLAAACSAAAEQTAEAPVPDEAAPSPTVQNTPKLTHTPIPTTTEGAEHTEPPAEPEAKYIFYFIGDGMGQAHVELSEEFLKYVSGDDDARLHLNSMNVNTMVTTHSANASITDSAAAGTALATGVKTDNAMITQSPEGEDLTTLLEAVQQKGFAAGIVTTTRITHATPACFYAHDSHRSHEAEIALDFPGSGVDFIAGGGLCYFLPSVLPETYSDVPPDIRGMEAYTGRDDDINVLDMVADEGYEMFLGPDGVDEFLEYQPQTGDKVFAPLTYNYFPYEADRLRNGPDFPSIADMTRQALRLLELNEDGFFLMVEGGRIDYAAHNNDALGVIYDTLAFDNAVALALEFYAAHPNETLIITTADHETGGLTLGDNPDFGAAFDSVQGIFASYGDGFSPLFHEAQSVNGYIAAVKAYGLKPDANELKILESTYEESKMLFYDMDELDTMASLALNGILNDRLGVVWTSDYHTNWQVNLGVTGVFEDEFEDAADNTDIANILAEILEVDIGL